MRDNTTSPRRRPVNRVGDNTKGADKMERAQQAYQDLINRLFKYDNNPTYELCGVTIVNLYGEQIKTEMALLGLIRYVGRNHNGLAVYQVR